MLQHFHGISRGAGRPSESLSAAKAANDVAKFVKQNGDAGLARVVHHKNLCSS